MPAPIPSTRNAYDHGLRDLVCRGGNVDLAVRLGVPRSTAKSWLRRGPRDVVSFWTALAASLVEISPLKIHCSDAYLLRVMVRDDQGGRLSLKEMLNTRVVEHDADRNGVPEL